MQFIDFGEEYHRLQKFYAQMSDGELQAMANDTASLTEMALELLRAEISRRGMGVYPPEAQLNSSVPAEDELVRVWLADDSTEAQEVRGILEAAGIPSWANARKVEFADGRLEEMQEVKVLKVAERAATSALTSRDPQEADEHSGELPVCPRCHSPEIVLQSLEAEPASPDTCTYSWRCDACGHRWKDDGLEQLA